MLGQYDIKLVDDEVMRGFGRTGQAFGCQTFNYQPDSMSIAKALSSAYLPISAVLLSPELVEIIEEEAGDGSAACGMPSPAAPIRWRHAVALKDAGDHERRNTFGHVRKVAPLFQQRLRGFARSSVGGRGQWRGPDRRHRDGRRQSQQTGFRGVQAGGRALRPGSARTKASSCAPLSATGSRCVRPW